MEIETSQSVVVAKKVWNIIRVVLFMLRKGIAIKKSKAMSELHVLLKRGKVAAGKAISNTLTLRHHYSSSAATFVAPRDYEFSCSNSPAIVFPTKRNNNKKHQHRHRHQYDDVSSTFQKVLEILQDPSTYSSTTSSPLVALPGFGKSPIGKKLIRVTDSPFPLKVEENDDDCHVDIAAEEFIKRFYKDLHSQQHKLAATSIQSPYHNRWIQFNYEKRQQHTLSNTFFMIG